MTDDPSTWHASAPTRVCDAGGWTDTWFAGHGRVVNLAVTPRATATVIARRRGDGPQVRLRAPDVDGDHEFDLDALPERHPLLEQSIAAAGAPRELHLDVTVRCDAPPGASMGTSASVMVALIAALDAAIDDVAAIRGERGRSPGRLDRAAIARRAHHVETELVGRQAGIQDQLAATHGGASDIVMHRYPHATVRPIVLDGRFVAELDAALLTVHLGSHDSSAVHRQVIEGLESEGSTSQRLGSLRRIADAAARALAAGDIAAFAAAMTENTDAQAALHPELVGADAADVIDLARRAGAAGWKVNGAGGSGGTVTVVCPPDRPDAREELEAAIAERAGWRTITTRFATDGVRVRAANANEGWP